jgi:hypothetical protein
MPLNETSKPLSWRVETEIKFFFIPGMKRTLVNDIGGKFSLLKETVPIPATVTTLLSPRVISILTSVSLRLEKCSQILVMWLDAPLSIYQICGEYSTELQQT